LLAAQRGPIDLGEGRIDQLLLVEDPGFWEHRGVDLTTKGAGLTTLSQSLSKEVGFQNFRPGIQKVRLIGYAIGLESRLSKQQILALYLNTIWMGRGPEGPLRGFFEASQVVFGRPPADLSPKQFLTLVAVPIAPRTMSLTAPGPALAERTRRIQRLVEGKCRPIGLRDVWLEGCAAPRQTLAE
jgi:membrane peptidoglycan carboxypeptidase